MNRILCLFLHEKHLLAATHEGENWQAALVSGERHWLPLNNEGSLRHAIDDLVARLGGQGMLEKYSLQIVADASSRSLLIGSQGLLAHGQFANWQASSWQVLDWQPLATRADWQGSGRPDHAWLQEHLLPILQTSLGWQKEALATQRRRAENEHAASLEALVEARARLEEENDTLRLRLDATRQIDAERLIRYLPALYHNVFSVLGPTDLALLTGRVEPYNIPSPYPEPGANTLNKLQREFRSLPRHAQQEIADFINRLPHSLVIRPEMKDLLDELTH